ncbi:HPF/RaiA family ribosome-associated protein [Halpernia frigidisoli]|uniref:Sigma 54 modulation protein / S30EA ribosomal protein n=1 Tax=Halpernia frigidisoli TaxID=1125876 RepID=A0A1I3F302_9FLAO|nr:HPF/RaiA family ribosome-associated protein [Halpernia frigidisoli]SFI05604.1 Sigma 54 modulation protein / S30EA ribosomal protein [Halpernia frigidisoli]
MEILINTDHNVESSEEMIAYYKSEIQDDFERFNEHLTRIEVKISDENGEKFSERDKKCVMEARLKGMQPFVVTSHEDTVKKAVKDASNKLKKSLDSTMGRLSDH